MENEGEEWGCIELERGLGMYNESMEWEWAKNQSGCED